MFCQKGVLRNFAKFTGKQMCLNLFFNKVAGLRPATLLKKWLCHRCFPVNVAKFLRTRFLQNTSFWVTVFVPSTVAEEKLSLYHLEQVDKFLGIEVLEHMLVERYISAFNFQVFSYAWLSNKYRTPRVRFFWDQGF